MAIAPRDLPYLKPWPLQDSNLHHKAPAGNAAHQATAILNPYILDIQITIYKFGCNGIINITVVNKYAEMSNIN